MFIGDVEVKGKVILGPMAGVTSLAYRDFLKDFDVALSFSEMISDCGLVYGNDRTYEYFSTSSKDVPVGLQLFGSDEKITTKAIEILESNASYQLLDINLGCPVTKVVKTGAGSAWLKDPTKLYSYMSSVVKASHKPVTAKIRLGWDSGSINFKEVVALLEKAGVSAITVHARTSRQMYSGQADYLALKGLKETMTVPLIISGDIFTLDDAIKAIEITHADGIMVARGGLGNPFLVTQIDTYFRTGERLPESTLKQQIEYARKFASALFLEKGDKVGTMQCRGLIPQFFKGFPGYKKIRMEIASNIKSPDDLFALLNGMDRRMSL